MTQGGVVKFAAGAAEAMRADGMNVLIEGRSQTLDYIRTPHRFELTLSDPAVIGMRRAAQRMMGEALSKLAKVDEPTPENVKASLEDALDGMSRAHGLSKIPSSVRIPFLLCCFRCPTDWCLVHLKHFT
jgi:hypothetical protein